MKYDYKDNLVEVFNDLEYQTDKDTYIGYVKENAYPRIGCLEIADGIKIEELETLVRRFIKWSIEDGGLEYTKWVVKESLVDDFDEREATLEKLGVEF